MRKKSENKLFIEINVIHMEGYGRPGHAINEDFHNRSKMFVIRYVRFDCIVTVAQ